FSSLHEQIRQRNARENRYDRQASEDVWELEQFVLDEVLQLVAERALTITGADGVAIALAQDNAIVCRASAGVIAPDAGMRLHPKATVPEVAVAPDFQPETVPATSPQVSKADHAKPGLRVAVLLIAIAIAIGGGLWWKIGRSSGVQRPEQGEPAISINGPSAAAPTNQATENDSSSSSELSSPLREKLSVLPQVTS